MRQARRDVRLHQRRLDRREELQGILHRRYSNPIDSDKNFVPPNNYLPGGPGDIVVVRLFYKWPLYVTGMGFNIANIGNNQRLLTATAAFQNEPY